MGLLQKFMGRNEPERMTNGVGSVTMGPERVENMELLLAFFIFLGCVAACMVLGASLSWALLVGLVCFALVGVRRGYSVQELGRMAAQEMKTQGRCCGFCCSLVCSQLCGGRGERWPFLFGREFP